MHETPSLQFSDQQLIEQVLAGQTEAFGPLVKRYWTLALAMAFTRCKNDTLAEDITQDSFIKAYYHLGSLKNQAAFAGWLIKIIHQECVLHHRRKQASIPIDPVSIDRLAPVFAVKSNPGLSRRQIDFVHQAIRKLPENLQNVVIMRFIGGLGLKEIAEHIEIKYGTVRVWLHRAYKLLKDDLAPILEEVQS